MEDQRQMLSYQERLVAGYMDKYELVTKQIVADYKVYAINAFLTERYCRETDQKYSNQKY